MMNTETYKYDLVVFIGRFQPFHKGHWRLLQEALKHGEQVLVLVGSANLAPDSRNPWKSQARITLIESIVRDHGFADRVIVRPQGDEPYENNLWLASVQREVSAVVGPSRIAPRVALLGHERDRTSNYLRQFPQWELLACTDTDGINATTVRTKFFAGESLAPSTGWADNTVHPLRSLLPLHTVEFLEKFRDETPDQYQRVVDQLANEAAYIKAWGTLPKVTADAVVIQSGHVLVGRPPEAEGGLFALPGGFLEVEREETLLETAERELFEETGLYRNGLSNDITPERTARLRRYQRGYYLFDHPHRSRRGRILTHAYSYFLPDEDSLPAVADLDDLSDVHWKPLSEVRTDQFFEDHGFIIAKMLRLFA